MSLPQPLGDGLVIARRNLIKIRRVPDLLVSATVAPVMFVLLFGYVLGSGVEVPGVDYREYLMAGIFTQTIVFGSAITGTGLAQDLQRGIVDRFRSLPMSPSAVLLGRTASDLVTSVIVVIVMTLTGLLAGWRIRSSPLDALAAYALLLLFAYALSWLMAVIGLSVRDPEVFSNASFVAVFPLTFVANTFVAPGNLPHVLRVAAEWNPVSAVVQACRVHFGNVSAAMPPPEAWPLRHPVAATLAWVAVILAVCVPLARWRYRKAVGR
ncbi:ABC transporter permease [Catellatospora bangladeshensis]|uniref:Transport permease protein n=1 Tax=Catellatospora bangladeshensis TaxID=310355 RepID=A0A8J3JGT9_9ACTN|nr:ABC transporter permease [Catellatospora bangladeshensis]GIF82364.1 transport permease protein [Catellatospora bangladeshensis]